MVFGCNFPQEISDSIIDRVADDRSTLKSCALTRRAWLQRSRHHLHRKITVEGSSRKPAGYYATPAAQYIQDLKLVHPPHPGQSARDNDTWRIISQFTEIKSLTLLYTGWSRGSYRILASIARNVTHLEILVSSFDDCDEFFAFVAMFPELRSLAVTSLTIGSAFGRSGIRIDPPSNLSSLRFGAHLLQPAIAQRLADWLAYLPATAIPRFSLTWRAPCQDGLPAVLRALNTRLAHLDLPVSLNADALLEGNIGNKLQSISFFVTGDLTTEKISELTSMLSQISSDDVRTIEIMCAGSSLIDLDISALQPIDGILSSHQFEDLRSLGFKFSGKSCTADLDEPETFKDRLRRVLRRTDSRRILSVDFK